MGIVESLKKEFIFEEEWVSYELHPETPRQGVTISEKFPDLDPEKFQAGLNARSVKYGIHFGKFSLISNSSMALQISELARETGVYEAFHKEMFRMYFCEGRDIGNINVIVEAGRNTGLDERPIYEAIDSGRFLGRLEQARFEALELKINAVPTFIIDGQRKIVGALPIDRFRAALSQK